MAREYPELYQEYRKLRITEFQEEEWRKEAINSIMLAIADEKDDRKLFHSISSLGSVIQESRDVKNAEKMMDAIDLKRDCVDSFTKLLFAESAIRILQSIRDKKSKIYNDLATLAFDLANEVINTPISLSESTSSEKYLFSEPLFLNADIIIQRANKVINQVNREIQIIKQLNDKSSTQFRSNSFVLAFTHIRKIFHNLFNKWNSNSEQEIENNYQKDEIASNDTIPKTEKELELWMKKNNYNFLSYSINGSPIYEGFGIDKFPGQFIWYYTERGIKKQDKCFQTERELIEYAYSQIIADKWAKTHCIGFTGNINEKQELEKILKEANIEFIQDQIPYHGIERPAYRTFVLGNDVNNTKHLKEKYLKSL